MFGITSLSRIWFQNRRLIPAATTDDVADSSVAGRAGATHHDAGRPNVTLSYARSFASRFSEGDVCTVGQKERQGTGYRESAGRACGLNVFAA